MHMHLSLIGRIAKGAKVRAAKWCLWYPTIRKSPSLPYYAFLTLLCLPCPTMPSLPYYQY